MMIDWDIQPYVALGPLRLGMSRRDVAALNAMIGPETDEIVGFDGSINVYRTMDVPVCSFIDDRLTAIDTNWRVQNVRFDGFDIYRAEPRQVLHVLSTANGGAHVGLGDVLYLKLGINTGGFFDADEDRIPSLHALTAGDDMRGLALFSRGAFDPLLHEYRTRPPFD